MNEPPQRRFRWRIVPAAFLLVFGGGLILIGLGSLGVATFAAVHAAVPTEVATKAFLRGLNVFGGLLWVAAGRWCIRSRWKAAAAGAVGGYAYLAALDGFLLGP